MRNVLVTGGAGFIGCNFVQYWMEQHPEDLVVVLDALTYAGDTENLSPVWVNERFKFVEGNICDQTMIETLLRDEQINLLVHFAAESHVDRSITGPDAFVETNIVGTHALLKAARQVWLVEGLAKTDHRFHHISTDEVFGALGPADPPFTEQTPYAPNSPYSASKASSDHLVRAYNKTYGLKTSMSNCSNNYGPYQNEEKLIPLTIGRILAGEPIPVYGDGSNIRDWLHVRDHCRAIEKIVLADVVGETFNIGGESPIDNLTLVQMLCDGVDEVRGGVGGNGESSRSLITFVTDRPGHDFRYDIDSQKITDELGFTPAVKLDEGLRMTIEDYIARHIS